MTRRKLAEIVSISAVVFVLIAILGFTVGLTIGLMTAPASTLCQ